MRTEPVNRFGTGIESGSRKVDLGFVPADGGFDTSKMARGAVDVLFLLGADEVNVQPGEYVMAGVSAGGTSLAQLAAARRMSSAFPSASASSLCLSSGSAI